MQQQTVFITGGTGGLGTEVVRRLGSDYRCVVFYSSAQSWEALRASLGDGRDVAGIETDLLDHARAGQSFRRAVEEFGVPWALVHLLGGYAPGSLLDTPPEVFVRMRALNAESALIAMRAVLPGMIERGGGRVVAITSSAILSPGKGSAAYTVAKTALAALVRVAAAEVAGTGVTVNALAPGSLDTPAMRAATDRSQLIPLDRVASTIAFLLAPEAGSINGSIIELRM